MGKRSRKNSLNLDFDPYDDYDPSDDDFDINDISRDFYSTDWGNDARTEERFSTRRKIERREDMKKLYSQMNDWEEFGSDDNYFV